MEHINGIYDIWVHISDHFASNKIEWPLGEIKLWFKQGLEEGNNHGIKDEFVPKQEDWYVFAEETDFGNPIVSHKVFQSLGSYSRCRWSVLYLYDILPSTLQTRREHSKVRKLLLIVLCGKDANQLIIISDRSPWPDGLVHCLLDKHKANPSPVDAPLHLPLVSAHREQGPH